MKSIWRVIAPYIPGGLRVGSWGRLLSDRSTTIGLLCALWMVLSFNTQIVYGAVESPGWGHLALWSPSIFVAILGLVSFVRSELAFSAGVDRSVPFLLRGHSAVSLAVALATAGVLVAFPEVFRWRAGDAAAVTYLLIPTSFFVVANWLHGNRWVKAGRIVLKERAEPS